MSGNIKKLDTPFVSIIMPAYNCERYVEEAVRSVIGQTHNNWELLVIDDGSTDSTYSIVERLAGEDTRIRPVSNPVNRGVSRTRNRGLDLSTGDYVAFLDGDDRWHPDKLSVQLKKMMDEKADLLYSSYAIVDAEGNPSREEYKVPENITFDALLKENIIGCSTVLMSERIAKKYRFQTDFYHEDYCLWLDILRDGNKTVGCSEVLVDWRLILNSRSFNKRKSAINRWWIYREYLKFSFWKSVRLFCCYTIRGIRKYCRR